MPFYKDQQNRVYAYDDGVDPKYIRPGLTPVTAEEAEALRVANLPPPPPVVRTPTRRQFKQALTAAGIRAAADAYVAAGDQDLKDWYNESAVFEENHPQVLAAQAALGMTDQQRVDLFQLAVTL